MEYLFAYIHLNPIKLLEPKWKEIGLISGDNAKAYLEKYEYSSYLDHSGRSRGCSKILNKAAFPDYFLTPKEHRDFVDFWLTQEGDFDQRGELGSNLSTPLSTTKVRPS